jgi:hypothetical protein
MNVGCADTSALWLDATRRVGGRRRRVAAVHGHWDGANPSRSGATLDLAGVAQGFDDDSPCADDATQADTDVSQGIGGFAHGFGDISQWLGYIAHRFGDIA